jgi:protein tyrosine phosphatase (PTP) superfamily phosphohydrolase (DUF442 family)
MTELSHITNFVQLTPTVGTAGQPRAEYFADIAAAGYDIVINLAMADSDYALPNEGSLVASLGMTYIHLPVNFQTPRPADVARFIGLMRSLDEQKSGHKILVHCVANLRVSAFMYHYLKLAKGYSDYDARSPVFKKWAPHMDDAWADLMSWTGEDIFG